MKTKPMMKNKTYDEKHKHGEKQNMMKTKPMIKKHMMKNKTYDENQKHLKIDIRAVVNHNE